MPCNCGGSAPQQAQTPQIPRQSGNRDSQLAQPPVRRTGGPGEPGYYSGYPKLDDEEQ